MKVLGLIIIVVFCWFTFNSFVSFFIEKDSQLQQFYTDVVSKDLYTLGFFLAGVVIVSTWILGILNVLLENIFSVALISMFLYFLHLFVRFFSNAFLSRAAT